MVTVNNSQFVCSAVTHTGEVLRSNLN